MRVQKRCFVSLKLFGNDQLFLPMRKPGEFLTESRISKAIQRLPGKKEKAMKKTIAFILSLMVILFMASAWAETAEPFFAQFGGMEWTFCSGVGGWSTDLRILPDGSFSGEYHDSEMGDCADSYPNGTVYCCSFIGQMSLMEQINEYTWRIRIDDLHVDESQEKESIDDGIRFVATEPYGISEGDDMLLYRPGTPVHALSEEMIFWTHALDLERSAQELEDWFLSNEKNGSGFVGYKFEETAEIANPWEDMTAEQLTEASGLSFGVPEGAENVIYRYLPSQGLAEMQFTWNNGEYCARIQPAALQEGELLNISGMYFEWENVETVNILHCNGTIGQAQTGSEDWVELCMWYDAVPGLMYSLSVATTDLDGLDLTALAEQVYLPVQADPSGL